MQLNELFIEDFVCCNIIYELIEINNQNQVREEVKSESEEQVKIHIKIMIEESL